jgi:hypothetical protein
VVAATPLSEWTALMDAHQPVEGADVLRLVHVVGVDPRQFRLVAGGDIADMPSDEYERFASDPTAALVSRGAVLTHGFRVGQRVELPIIPGMAVKSYPNYSPPAHASFNGHFVAQIQNGIFSDRVVVTHLSVQERLGWTRNLGIIVRHSPDVEPSVLGKRIEAHFQNTSEPVETLVLDQWIGGIRILVEQLSSLVLGIVGLAGLLAGAMIAYSVTMGGFELLPQIAVLRALGLSRSKAVVLLAGEGIVVAFLGTLVATIVVSTLASTTALIDLKQISDIFSAVFRVRFSSVIWVMSSGLAIALLGSVIPAAFLSRSAIATMRWRG